MARPVTPRRFCVSAGRPGRRGQPRTAALPPLRPAVRAGRTDDAPPLHPALGGDLLLTVEAVRPVLVVLVEVLGSQFQAVGAADHQGRVIGVGRGHAL